MTPCFRCKSRGQPPIKPPTSPVRLCSLPGTPCREGLEPKQEVIGSLAVSHLLFGRPPSMQERAARANVNAVASGDTSRVYIEDIYPAVDAGRFAVKGIAGEPIEVWA